MDSALGLTQLCSKATPEHAIQVQHDSWSLEVNGRTIGWPDLGCVVGKARAASSAAFVNYTCGSLTVQIIYHLPVEQLFIEKQIRILVESATLEFNRATSFQGLLVRLLDEPSASWHIHENPFRGGLHIAAFLRGPKSQHGAFLSVANPWANLTTSPQALTASYIGHARHRSSLQGPWFRTEPTVLGLTNLSKYSSQGLNVGERMAFMRCVESYHLDKSSRETASVKVNVAWDENDYQIDVGTSEGRNEYKRIIDRNSQLGVTHIVYGPGNSLHASRFNTTDGWGWEFVLWFSMGEQLREGKWDPRADQVPLDILDMVAYAESRGVKLLAYAYPCLAFAKVKDFFVEGDFNILSLAEPEVQSYLIGIMSAFLEKTGAGGFAWDHNIFAGDVSLQYAQWRAWMHILKTVRGKFKDIVMDHRYDSHAWGPWYHLAGSYVEPIAGDENPETYGVRMTSLHTDHVAANNMRHVNYVYSTRQLIPPSRIPGFAFHQTERTDDDGTSYCFGGEGRCVNNSNTRDFDFLGYKYSLLSSIGTAGLNNVITMIPARDMAEFAMLPVEDLTFIKKWLVWTDEHLVQLANTQWIPTLPGPSIGHVDGTHSMSEDEGFIFLFNPNMREMSVRLSIDESVGLRNSSMDFVWEVHELYPLEGHVATWQYGEQPLVVVEGSNAKVLQLKQFNGGKPTIRLLNANMKASVSMTNDTIRVTEVFAASGGKMIMALHLQCDPPTQALTLIASGKDCGKIYGTRKGDTIFVSLQFAGDVVAQTMPISDVFPDPLFVGGWFNTTFMVSAGISAQLSRRQMRYPIPWIHDASTCSASEHCVLDSNATWLIPSRLLLVPFLTQPSDSMEIRLVIDGLEVELRKSYNSRGRQMSKCFLGFYWDASSLLAQPGKRHTVDLWVPPIPAGSFSGLFWENIETEYTSSVASCTRQTAVEKEVIQYI